ncbi:hypothetical protein GIB67_015924 [Kingdonia uniflora]|uniref:Non-haem dioxygenase N-terminal domain-containing protein n=1 Tax=Kingdonia uniflora TaxID=39325 RepID=A0A7J7PCA0_9MAGN|nr:hypothetical protein GIB67_015924 [Kingdonia uniflora]
MTLSSWTPPGIILLSTDGYLSSSRGGCKGCYRSKMGEHVPEFSASEALIHSYSEMLAVQRGPTSRVHYDHLVLLDYLISKDTGIQCLQYLLRCLRLHNQSQHLFWEVLACGDETSWPSCKIRKISPDIIGSSPKFRKVPEALPAARECKPSKDWSGNLANDLALTQFHRSSKSCEVEYFTWKQIDREVALVKPNTRVSFRIEKLEEIMEEVDLAFIQDVEHRPKPVVIEAGGFPLIDLSSYNNPIALDALVTEIGDACKNWRFFQVINHGVPYDLLKRVEIAAKKFFDLPLEEKRRVGRDEEYPLGYYNTEHTKNVRDWKEVFDFTVANPVVGPASHED